MTSAIGQFEAQQAGKERIGKALINLALARQASDFGDAGQRVYVPLLADLDAAMVAGACAWFARQPRADYTATMPSVGDLRAKASELAREARETAQRAKLLPLPASVDDEPRFFCTKCFDEPSGWRVCWCPGDGSARESEPNARALSTLVASCGRTGHGGVPHQPHTYTERCSCWTVNPVIAKQRQRMDAKAATK